MKTSGILWNIKSITKQVSGKYFIQDFNMIFHFQFRNLYLTLYLELLLSVHV